ASAGAGSNGRSAKMRPASAGCRRLLAGAGIDIELAFQVQALGHDRCLDRGKLPADLGRDVDSQGPCGAGQEVALRKGLREEPAAVSRNSGEFNLVGANMHVAAVGD